MILDKRFIKTGPDLRPEDLTAAAWPLGEIAVLARNQSGGIVALDDVRGATSRAGLQRSAKVQLPSLSSIRYSVR
jgi:hypothetical protein